MPRKLPEKVRKAPRKLGKHGSKRRYRTSKRFLQRPPVRKNEELEVVIDDIGREGEGIAIIQGYRILVPRTDVAENVKIRIISVGSECAVAERTT